MPPKQLGEKFVDRGPNGPSFPPLANGSSEKIRRGCGRDVALDWHFTSGREGHKWARLRHISAKLCAYS
jgi:hypothetical protein